MNSVAIVSLAEFRKVAEVNQTAPLLGMQAVIPGMKRAGRGSIVKRVVHLRSSRVCRPLRLRRVEVGGPRDGQSRGTGLGAVHDSRQCDPARRSQHR